ncbi:MAG: replication-associated recombination protein A [Elusimicrobiota bacterium]
MKDLFIKEKNKNIVRPLAYRMRPLKLEDYFGQEHLVGKDKILYNLIQNDALSSMIFFGPSGSGKTALVKIISEATNTAVKEINAVTAGVADLRKTIDSASEYLDIHGKGMLVMIDEIHHFNRSQQDALLPAMENGTVIVIGLTTENPYFYINNALLSRATVCEFKPLSEDNLKGIIKNAISNEENGLGGYNIEYTDEVLSFIVRFVNGDARYALNIIENVAQSQPKNSKIIINKEHIEECVGKRVVQYDKNGDQHYDVISAFIKSMRGSDPDAALYWLAVMLRGGEDPRFIARRIAILAAEDVGNAAPMALCVAQSAWDLVERVGMPEARIILAQAVTMVTSCPKSNASYLGIDSALADVDNKKIEAVPNHLKDANLDKDALGHGKGYKYPHEYPDHFVKQKYRGNFFSGEYYKPTNVGKEKIFRERLNAIWGISDEEK